MKEDEGLGGAFTVSEFCTAFRVGRTFLYGQLNSGRLVACKAGTKTLILRSEAARWARSLPKRERPNES
jgi:hypothetical protein